MNRNLSPMVAKGIYGGPREIKGGDYARGMLGARSGAKPMIVSPVNGSVQGAYAERNRIASR